MQKPFNLCSSPHNAESLFETDQATYLPKKYLELSSLAHSLVEDEAQSVISLDVKNLKVDGQDFPQDA